MCFFVVAAAAPKNGSSYDTSTGNTRRDVILRPSPPATSERTHEENLPPRPTTIDDPGVSVTKTTTNLPCGRKRCPAGSEAFVDSSGASERHVAQQQTSAAPSGLDSNTDIRGATTSSTSTTHGNGSITAEGGGGRDLDERIFNLPTSPVLVRSGSSTTHDGGAIATESGGGRDLDASVNSSLRCAGLDRSGRSSTYGRPAVTAAGGGGRNLDARVIENLSSPALVVSGNSTSHGRGSIAAVAAGTGGGRDLDAGASHSPTLSGRNGLEQVTAGRAVDESYPRTEDSYARPDNGYARTDGFYARSEDSYARTDDDYALTDDSYARRARTVVVVDRNRRLYNAAPAPPSRYSATAPSRTGYNGGVVADGSGGGGGVRGVSGVSRTVAMVEKGGGGCGGGGGGRGFSVSKWQCRKSSDVSARQTARSDTSRQQQRWTSATFAPGTGTTTTRSGTVIDTTGSGNPGRCGSTAINIDTTPTRMPLKRTASLDERSFHEPRRFSSGVRTVTDSSEGGGQRVKRGPFRAPVAPLGRSDSRAGVFDEERYLASPVSYPRPRPCPHSHDSHHSHHIGYGEQRGYRDTQSVRRDMSLEEPLFSKRKSFRVSEEKEEGQQDPRSSSKRRWPDDPARWSGDDNGNGARYNPHGFAIHTVPVALAADAPCERTGGVGKDGRLYYSHSRQGQPLEGRRPQGEMPRNSFSSNTAQILSERGGGRYELGPTVTPPPFR